MVSRICCRDFFRSLSLIYRTGDIGHKHFLEPTSLDGPVDRFLRLSRLVTHRFAFFHIPIPPSVDVSSLRDFIATLEPLLPIFTAQQTELYLGVIQAHDEEGTITRIQVAQEALHGFPFGTATECGWGRTPAEDIESILRISKACCGCNPEDYLTHL
jgi:hypothetical protein